MDAPAISRAIARKRDGQSLAELWPDLIAHYLDGTLDDAQMGALLMASMLRGLEPEETRAMTEAFVASGERLEQLDPRTVDKHSTGGVGDTASLIVVPWVAACGVPVAKLSGHALGHTGGTLDKLESVAGVCTELSPEQFLECVAEAGCAIAAQSARLVPADRRIYALRDRTATVGEPGLIAASIVSKKIAGGAFGIAYDVKTGSGALLREPSAARALADSLVMLTAAFGRRAIALVTDMSEPLGPSIGTGLEMAEARDFLRGTRRDARLARASHALALRMLRLAGFEGDAERALALALDGGGAAERLERMLAAQGAHPGALDALAPDDLSGVARAPRSGFVTAIDPVALGELARELVLRHGERAGIVVAVRAGDEVVAGRTLATVYGEADSARLAARAFELGDEPPPPAPLVYDEIEAGFGSRSTLEGATAGSAPGRSTLETK
jgi:pyrimidine-nucleoside phosphorylase